MRSLGPLIASRLFVTGLPVDVCLSVKSTPSRPITATEFTYSTRQSTCKRRQRGILGNVSKQSAWQQAQ